MTCTNLHLYRPDAPVTGGERKRSLLEELNSVPPQPPTHGWSMGPPPDQRNRAREAASNPRKVWEAPGAIRATGHRPLHRAVRGHSPPRGEKRSAAH